MRPYRESRLQPKGLAEIGMASTEQSSETRCAGTTGAKSTSSPQRCSWRESQRPLWSPCGALVPYTTSRGKWGQLASHPRPGRLVELAGFERAAFPLGKNAVKHSDQGKRQPFSALWRVCGASGVRLRSFRSRSSRPRSRILAHRLPDHETALEHDVVTAGGTGDKVERGVNPVERQTTGS